MEKATFTVEGYAVIQRIARLSDEKNSGVLVPRNWEGKNVVCILTEKPPED